MRAKGKLGFITTPYSPLFLEAFSYKEGVRRLHT